MQGNSEDAIKEFITNFDLGPVERRLIYLEKWKPRHAKEACEQLKNFFFLQWKYGAEYKLPPSTDMDEAWHAFILHTRLYHTFCEKVFGKFLHHHPGIYDEHGQIINDGVFGSWFEENTQRLHREEFGDYIYAVRPILLKLLKLWFQEKLHKAYQFLGIIAGIRTPLEKGRV